MDNNFNENSLFTKIKKVFKKTGIKLIYIVLLLFYVLQSKETPYWIRIQIIGALLYFISPLDAIPDYIPVAGYSDDLGLLTAALISVGMYIDQEIKNKARKKIMDWFGDIDENQLIEIDEKIK